MANRSSKTKVAGRGISKRSTAKNVAMQELQSLLDQRGEIANVWVLSWQGEIMDPQALSYGLLDGNTRAETALLFGDVRVDRDVCEQIAGAGARIATSDRQHARERVRPVVEALARG